MYQNVEMFQNISMIYEDNMTTIGILFSMLMAIAPKKLKLGKFLEVS